MDPKQVDLESVMLHIRRAPGIVVGANMTMPANGLGGLFTRLIDKHFSESPDYSKPDGLDLFRLLDELSKKDELAFLQFEEDVFKRLREHPPTATVRKLAEVEWSVCISLAFDLSFESALQEYIHHLPVSRTVTLIENKHDELPQDSIPIYRLLGSPHPNSPRDSVALRLSSLYRKKQDWSMMLRTCSNRLLNAPLIVVGAPASPSLFVEFIGALQALDSPRPRDLLFVGEDSVPGDPVTLSLLEDFRCTYAECTPSELVAAVNQRAADPGRFSLKRTVEEDTISVDVPDELRGTISLVPNKTRSVENITAHHASIVDSLFRPSSTDWRPFLAQLDLKRSCTETLVEKVLDALEVNSSRSPLEALICVRGESGVGKTTLLKRVALELSDSQTFVFWLNYAQHGRAQYVIRRLIDHINKLIEKQGEVIWRFVFVIDDPNSGGLHLSGVAQCFDRATFPFALLSAFRNSDFYLGGEVGSDLPIPDARVLEVDELLDEKEIALLPGVLSGINATETSDAASRLVADNIDRNARDILCSLWYLLPATREYLKDSLRDEYQRLGRFSDSVSALASAAHANAGQVAKSAYEAVTVCSELGVRLPIEVLVSSLEIDYDEWVDMTAQGRPLWGLLYDVESDQGDTIWYETRNHIVTKVLLDLVNGAVGHAGELRVLRKLFDGCNAGSLVYRNFIVQVLVDRKDELEKRYSYTDVRDLFERARSSLPHEDRLLEHHLGILIGRYDPDKRKAHQQLLKALSAEEYPQVSRRTQVEHIHTSIANNVVIQVRQGDISVEDGLKDVTTHLNEAGSGSRFDAHHAHVSGKMLLELATMVGSGETEASLAAFQESLSEIERGFQFLGASPRVSHDRDKSVEMLTALQRTVLTSLPDASDLEGVAASMLERDGSLVGYEVLARSLLSSATQTGRGRDYNKVWDLLEDIKERAQDARVAFSFSLVKIKIDLIIRWRIQRAIGTDWVALKEDFEVLLNANRLADDVLRLFYYAVTLYHCDEIGSANAVFGSLSRMTLQKYDPYQIRCYYTGRVERPLHLQCEITQQAGRYYANLRQVGSEVRIRRRDQKRASKGPSHVYLGFSLSGPRAALLEPDIRSLTLPGG